MEKSDETFEVRDLRSKSIFRMDDEYLNGYAKLCGINATGVYVCLCRHADRNQISFPSIKSMSEKLGISERSVQYAVAALKQWNIIDVGKDRFENGKFKHNTYTLIDKNYWASKPHANIADGSHTQMTTQPHANDDINQTHHVRTKVAQAEKVAHNKDTHNDVFSFFERDEHGDTFLYVKSTFPHLTDTQITKELTLFFNYWEELDLKGKKKRWQLQKTFEPKRRLVTWFSNKK